MNDDGEFGSDELSDCGDGFSFRTNIFVRGCSPNGALVCVTDEACSRNIKIIE
ncbi:hypothetical protein MA16_Dca013877 [Dendrobium catenatum]|uniref:Uncharacterized protein n=1 Tax=Dendrobium catenatum TaxID=906689 RepID=A0A2I0WCM5_9ASPA|nr:hypothetical protein MA16_Dca013877 [Dendrobium catenatum]